MLLKVILLGGREIALQSLKERRKGVEISRVRNKIGGIVVAGRDEGIITRSLGVLARDCSTVGVCERCLGTSDRIKSA